MKNLERVEEIERLVPGLLESPLGIDEIAFKLMRHYSVEVTPQKLALNLVPARAVIAELYNRGLIDATVE